MDRRRVGHCVSGDPYGEGSDIGGALRFWLAEGIGVQALAVAETARHDFRMRMKGAMAGITILTCSRRTRHAELLRLCARIGYSPPTPS